MAKNCHILKENAYKTNFLWLSDKLKTSKSINLFSLDFYQFDSK